MNEETIRLAETVDRLSRTSRLQDLSLLLAQSESHRIGRIATVLSGIGPGTFLIGTGPYTQGVYSVMTDEIILGRLATPLEEPLDKPVDIFCQDIPCLTPREVSRYHAKIYRLGDTKRAYFIADLGSTCGTFVNKVRLDNDDPANPANELFHGDVISLGPSHVNTYVFAAFENT